MVRALQKKFIKAAMLAITLLIVSIFIAINIFSVVSTFRDLNSTMDLLCSYGGDRGSIPVRDHSFSDDLDEDDFPFPDDEQPSEEFIRDFMNGRSSFDRSDRDKVLTTVYFSVRFDPDNNVVFTDISQISSLTEETAAAIALEVYKTGRSSGRAGDYMYRITDNGSLGHTVIFLDTNEELHRILQTAIVSLGITVAAWLIMLALVIFLSKKAIRPIAENIERQKQFVTNAGHELKTPLAIIQSNTEAMELFNGENKWSRNIKAQVSRLSDLTKNLLTLSRMDESADSMLIENLDLSELVAGQLQTFASSFEQKGISVSENIQKDISFKGDRGQLGQLMNLLFDNAVKYTNDNGTLSVSLTKKGSKILFVSKNTCESLPSCPPDKLFDRFYRSDESHTQKSGGQGIGLSVAASIAENHGGSITAEYSEADSSISFILKL